VIFFKKTPIAEVTFLSFVPVICKLFYEFLSKLQLDTHIYDIYDIYSAV
jgi:hypothetical protein